jgi:Probable lipoprotein LpqN
MAATAALALALSSCGAETPDYQSIWSTSATTAAPTSEQAGPPLPISAYLESVGVTGGPVAAEKLPDLAVTFPTPGGWHPYQNQNLAPGTRMIAKGDTYPTAMLMVFKLTGDFDAKEAIKHGNVDAEMSQNFKRLNASTDNFRGFPSSMIEGSYDLNGQRMHSYNRIVIATGAPPTNNRYLVQFTVTGYADKAAEEASDIETVIKGFNVEVPKPAPAPPKPAPPK